MNFDTLSTTAMADELRKTLVGSRLQRIVQINSLTFGLELFVHPIRYNLTISVEPRFPRLFIADDKVRRGNSNETPLMLVLRKYLRASRLWEIEQPFYERILYFHFENYLAPSILVVELLGTRSNLVLLDADNIILGTARLSKQNTDAKSAQRLFIPGEIYQPPSAQQKLTVDQLTELRLRQQIEQSQPNTKLAKFLPRVVRGVSPLAGREIAYQATGQADITLAQVSQFGPLITACQAVFEPLETRQWTPTVAFDTSDDNALPIAFAPYPLTHQPHARTYDDFSTAVQTFFVGTAAGYAAAKRPLLEALEEARRKLDRRLQRLTEDEADLKDPSVLQEKGNAILASIHLITPGQVELNVSWQPDVPPLRIQLDPTLSASENAQKYFGRYRKTLRAAEEIPAQREQITLDLAYLAQLEQDIAMAEDRQEIDAIAAVLVESDIRPPQSRANKPSKRKAKNTAGRYLRQTAPDGAMVWVGKNAKQNAQLTFDKASPSDLWLHARGIPGAHVIIPTAQGLPSEDDVLFAASLAAYYSKARYDTSVEVDVTLKKQVRAIKGGALGLVTYRNEYTLRVAPQPPLSGED